MSGPSWACKGHLGCLVPVDEFKAVDSSAQILVLCLDGMSLGFLGCFFG